jgi:hypothetical protein
MSKYGISLPAHTLKNEEIKCVIETMEFCSAIEKNEILSFAGK